MESSIRAFTNDGFVDSLIMPADYPPEIVKEGQVTVVALGPEYENLDEPRLDALTDVLLQVAETASPPVVVLDLSHTSFFGSAFIEVIFRMWNRLNHREGGKFCICGLSEYCTEVLEVTHLDQLWETFPDRASALSALNS
nr:STAS domain-containing protein [Gimesia panareensis]